MRRKKRLLGEHGIRRGDSTDCNEHLILDLFGVYSWTELFERAGEIEMIQAFLVTQLVNWNTSLRLSLKEQAEQVENRREFIRRAEKKWCLTESAVMHYVYDY